MRKYWGGGGQILYTDIFICVCSPRFLTGITPLNRSPLSRQRGEVGGSPSASPPGSLRPSSAEKQASKEGPEDREGRAAAEFGGRRYRPKGRLPSPIGIQLPPLHPKMTPRTGAPRETSRVADTARGLPLESPQPRGEHCTGEPSPGRRSIASGLGPGSSEAPKV